LVEFDGGALFDGDANQEGIQSFRKLKSDKNSSRYSKIKILNELHNCFILANNHRGRGGLDTAVTTQEG
jgi:hypothetical protein